MIYDPRSIRLSSDQQEEIAALAARMGLPWEALLENALQQTALRASFQPTDATTIGDVARQLGVVGCIASGLGDLSTNPAHMEGFGQSHGE